jgi:hypothetical protein
VVVTPAPRYARFRDLGLFCGSGAVEGGCKNVIGARMKQSGMRWSLRGASAITELRCQDASGTWNQIWPKSATRQAQPDQHQRS